MSRLWTNHDIVYPHLRAMLTRPLPASVPPSARVAREIALARAATVRDICRTRFAHDRNSLMAGRLVIIFLPLPLFVQS